MAGSATTSSPEVSILGLKFKFDNTMALQACAGFTGGFVAAPLFQISNKSSLPGITPKEVIRLTAEKPFRGALWAATRQSLSSIRGTVSILMMRDTMQKKNEITIQDFWKACLAASAAETIIAGVPFEIPETRVQSGFSKFSWHCAKAVPFIYFRNVVTTIAPAYFIREEMLRGGQDGGSSKEEKGWGAAIAATAGMSCSLAILVSPMQGIVGRILQEESVSVSIKNSIRDFDLRDPLRRRLTFLRVGTRSMAVTTTGLSITLAYLVGRDVLK
jgi:hypothetical protein